MNPFTITENNTVTMHRSLTVSLLRRNVGILKRWDIGNWFHLLTFT